MLGRGKKDDGDDKAMAEIKALHEKITALEKKVGEGDAQIAQLQKLLNDAQGQVKALEGSLKQAGEVQAMATRLEQQLKQLQA
jgi:peptidoglycan hydrolase CwlO-like protein